MKDIHKKNIISCANDIIKHFKADEELLDAKDTFEKFYSNTIALSVLGVCTNCNYDAKSKVHEIACDINNCLTSTRGGIKLCLLNNFPWMNIKVFPPKIYDFFHDLVTEEIRNRLKKKIKNRSDFLQHAINMQSESNGVINWSNSELIIAQVMSFFTAGFTTTSSLFQACCFVLARKVKIQETFFEGDSHFVEDFIEEVLRKYSPIFMISRICGKNCSIKCKTGENYRFFKGDLVEVPVRILNNDPRLIDDPQLINPLRNVKNIISPFGIGPRACIGRNFAIFVVKTLLIKLIENFEILPCDETPYDLKFCDIKNLTFKLKKRN